MVKRPYRPSRRESPVVALLAVEGTELAEQLMEVLLELAHVPCASRPRGTDCALSLRSRRADVSHRRGVFSKTSPCRRIIAGQAVA